MKQQQISVPLQVHAAAGQAQKSAQESKQAAPQKSAPRLAEGQPLGSAQTGAGEQTPRTVLRGTAEQSYGC